MDEGRVQPEAVSSQSWRDTSDETTSEKQWTPLKKLQNKLYDKAQIRPSSRDAKLKMAMHHDLLRRFAACRNNKDGEQAHIKDRFNFVQKPRQIHRRTRPTTKLGMLLMKNVKLDEDKSLECKLVHGLSTMSCYENVPREQPDEIGDGIVLESAPDVTEMLENVSIREPYHMTNDPIPKTLSTDLIDRTVSLDIGANLQNSPGSQLSVINGIEVDFSRGFREYCTNTINRQLNDSLEKFLAELKRLQRNLYNRDNTKGRFKRRFYAGFREIEKRFKLNKVKLVIVAPNIEKNKEGDGELDKLIHRFIDSCRRHEVPVVFGLSRRKLGYLTHGKGLVSCIGVANYEALEEKLEDVLKKVVDNRNEFKILSGQADKTVDMTKLLKDDFLLSERVKLLLKILVSH